MILARKRMSGAELARRTGMKQPYLSRRMTGEIAFDLDDLEVIATALGVSVEHLVSGADPSSGSQTTVPKGTATERTMATQPFGGGKGPIQNPATRRPARVIHPDYPLAGLGAQMGRAA